MIEHIETGDLTIVRNALPQDLLTDLQTEALDFYYRTDYDRLKCVRCPNSIGFVVSLFWSETPNFSEIGFPALAELMDITNEPHGQSFAINYQDPFSSQHFHSDIFKPGIVQTVQLTDGGAFDFIPDNISKAQELSGFHEVEVQAGDIVKQHRPASRHRGRNKSAQPRINIGRY